MDFNFEAMDLNRLYRASDALYKHREALQDHLFDQVKSIFGFGETVTLYDLTNTYFEGIAAGVAKAKRGRSKVERVGLTGVAGEELHAPHEAAGV